MPLNDEDRMDIDSYFYRNYRRGEPVDVSCRDKGSNQSWIGWKNKRLRRKGWQKNGKPFLNRRLKWKSEEPPRRLLREVGKSGGQAIHPSHMEFKVFLQDRVEKITQGEQSPRLLHRYKEEVTEEEEYIETWKRLANRFQKDIFYENETLTKIPSLESRLLKAIDYVLEKVENLEGGLKIPKKGEKAVELSIDDVLRLQQQEENSFKKTTEQISRIVVKSLISKSINSFPRSHVIFQYWRDKFGDDKIIEFYKEETGITRNFLNLEEDKIGLVKSDFLDAYKSINTIYSVNNNLWDNAVKKFGTLEIVNIHCTAFEVIRDIGDEIYRLLKRRIEKVQKETNTLEKRKKLEIYSHGKTKQMWNDLFKAETGLTNRGFGKRPPGVTDWREVTRHNSMQLAYNIANILLELEYLDVRMMDENQYRNSFMDGDQDKEISRAVWKEYPYLLIFTEKLKRLITKSEFSHFKLKENNAIFRWMRQPPHRFMYCPPENHNFTPLRGPSNSHSYSDRIKQYSPGGFLNKELRQLVSNHGAYEAFEQPRSLPSIATIDALNSLQSVQWEINLDLLERICDIHLYDGSQLGKFIDSEGRPSKTHEIKEIKIKDDYSTVFLREDDIHFSDRRKLTLSYIRRIIEHNANVYWHSWSCDFRGRMQPTSTILSPQGNDIDRALIRFKEWKPLGIEGIRWLRIHVYNLMEGIMIDGWKEEKPAEKLKSFDHRNNWVEENLKLLRAISSDLHQYRQELQLDRPASTKSEVFQRLAVLIELDRVYKEWEIQDKDESKRDWSKVNSGQPVYIDASSNGYQHVSCLLRNRGLAEKVNVIPNSLGTPEDLYGLVAEEARKVRLERIDGKWKSSNTGEKAEDFMRDILSKVPDWYEEDIERALNAIFSRGIAKRPTMTRVYGSRDILKSLWGRGGEGKPKWAKEMKDQLTTEEREARNRVPPSAKIAYSSWKAKKTDHWPLARLTEDENGKISWQKFREWNRAMNEYRYLPVWAIGSSLYDALIHNMDDDKISNSFVENSHPKVQGEIAKLLRKSLDKAIDNVTDGAFFNFEGRLRDIVKINTIEDRFTLTNHNNNRNNSEWHIYRYDDQNTIIEKVKGNQSEAKQVMKELIFLHPGAGWLLDDGFEVRNYYIKQDSDKTRKGAPTHVGSSYKEGLPDWYRSKRTCENIVKRIEAVFLNSQEAKRLLEARDPDILAIKDDLNNITVRSELKSIMTRIEKIKPLKRLVSENGAEISGLLHHRSYSFPRFDPDERRRISKKKPKSAFAPNFVHSLDALHMRKTINQFQSEILAKSEGFGFWAVHDAFGTHPSDVDLMIDILKTEFRTIHRDMNLDDWIKNISDKSGLDPHGDKVKEICDKLKSHIGGLTISEIATSDYLVH